MPPNRKKSREPSERKRPDATRYQENLPLQNHCASNPHNDCAYYIRMRHCGVDGQVSHLLNSTRELPRKYVRAYT